MRLGIISDTHIPSRAPRLAPWVLNKLKGVDVILHAGDIEHPKVLDALEAIAPVVAVAGNMDVDLPHLPITRQLEYEGWRVGLMHGFGGPRQQIREWVRKHFEAPDIIVYGHTHLPYWAEEAGVWFMNPGSATAGIDFPSIGILELHQGIIHGEIIRL